MTQTLTTTKDPHPALTTALHLADMSPDQLATASRSLADAEERYDRMSGICATLGGLVLLEAKRRLEHGQFGNWLKEHFGKSHHIATTRMRIAKEFIAAVSTKDGKLVPRYQFEATQLLLDDFAAQLAAEKQSPIDLENPVVSAVSDFVGGRNFNTLRASLPAARRGGNTYERDGEKGKRVPLTEEAAQQLAIETWKPILEGLLREGIDEKSYAALPDRGLVSLATLKRILIQLNQSIPAID
jgi:hypothetical protein